MEERLDMLIRKLKEKGYAFMTYSEFAQIKGILNSGCSPNG